jgi:hypothetical protein
LVLVYRPFGCIKEKDEVNLNEMTTVSSKASSSSSKTVDMLSAKT